MLLLAPNYLLSNKASSALCPVTYLSVKALLWVSLAAWRSSSRRLLSVSSLSTSPRVHFLGLINRISFKSSSFSLINIRRSRSESSTPGQASLSSLTSCIFRFAILQEKKKKKAVIPWGVSELLLQTHKGAPWPTASSIAVKKALGSGTPSPSCLPHQGAAKCWHRWEADTQNGILTRVCSQW